MKVNKSAIVPMLGLVAGLLTSTTYAASTPEAAVKKAMASHVGEAKIEEVLKTPYLGLFEVRTDDGNIVYTDAKAQYIFNGHILDTKTAKDLTQARIDKTNTIKFSDLPLDLAVKMVKGNGKRVIAIFEDPNCGYCKRFRQSLQGVDNLTVYTFMYNILSEESTTTSKNIWCSADRNTAWDEWMLHGKVAAAAAADCTTPNDKILALGRKLKITGTPTIFFADGMRMPGAVDVKTLEAKLSSLK
jgi:thiol:disulfide interchange protein DsbC